MNNYIKFYYNDNNLMNLIGETLWGKILNNDLIQVMNIPYYITGLSYGDIISCQIDENNKYFFHHIVSKSGHQTIHLYLIKNKYKNKIITTVKKTYNCSLEIATDNYISIDIPPDVNIQIVQDYLNEKQQDGILIYAVSDYGKIESTNNYKKSFSKKLTNIIKKEIYKFPNEIIKKQKSICDKYNTNWVETFKNMKIGVGKNIDTNIMPLNGLREKINNDFSGWFIWKGEDFPIEDNNFFRPMCAYHLEQDYPEIINYLGLPPGWRFLTANNYEDAWKDRKLIES